MARKRPPTETIEGIEGATLGDFGSWAYSDILCNANRAVFAEYLVASALGVTEVPRTEWDAVDMRYRGAAIEVKSSAYVQSWPQTRPSTITFGIAPRLGWDAETNISLAAPGRSADIYIFCLYPHVDRESANILDVPAWEFYVVPTHVLETHCGARKSIRLSPLLQLAGAVAHFNELKPRVDMAVESLSTAESISIPPGCQP